MSSRIHRLLTGAAGVTMAAALVGAPGAAAAPIASNCLPSADGQQIYCDQDVNADGSWIRCGRAAPESLPVLGGIGASVEQSTQDCQLVTQASLPLGSPPYHIGYGGEATGRV